MFLKKGKLLRKVYQTYRARSIGEERKARQDSPEQEKTYKERLVFACLFLIKKKISNGKGEK